MRLWTTIVAICLAGPAQAQGWWSPDWPSRATLLLDNSAQTESLVDFPVLVVLDDATNFDHSAVLPNGDDLRFIDGDGVTELAYEIESWNVGGVSHLWVRVPLVDGASDTDRVWMYYGNPSPPGPGENRPGTWRSSYVGVYHFDGDVLDSSSPTHHGSDQNTSSTTGAIASARDFDGDDDEVRLADESSFDLTTALTASFWIRVDAFVHGDWDAMLTKGDDTWRIHRCGGSNTVSFSTNFTTGDSTNRNNCGSVDVNDGNWHYVTAVYDQAAGLKTLYVDGVQDVQVSESRTLSTNDESVWVGNNSDFTDRSLDGRIDEVRIENAAHSADWVAADHLSVSDDFVVWCTAWSGDADADGVCDSEDACPGADDFLDTDVDGVPDCLDPCPADNPDDTDGDGVCTSEDACEGFPDGADADYDTVPDGCDVCPGFDDAADGDGDGLADGCDPCPFSGGQVDADGDGAYDCVDCDDGDLDIYPGAYDVPNNGIDEDCSGGDATAPTTGTGTGTGTASGSGTGSGTGTGSGSATGSGTGTGTGSTWPGTYPGTGATTGTGTGAVATGTPGVPGRDWDGVDDTAVGVDREAIGCGCTSTGGAGWTGLWVLGLLGLRRSP